MGHAMRRQPPPSAAAGMMTLQPNPAPFCRRQLGLTSLDLTDCVSVEDSGLKMIVETCPQLQYLFLRRCVNLTGDFIYHIPPTLEQRRLVLLRDAKFGMQQRRSGRGRGG